LSWSAVGRLRKFKEYAPHVLGRFNRRDEFEDTVRNAYSTDDASEYPINSVRVKEDRSNEDVDCGRLAVSFEIWEGPTYRFLGR
jgi:hypothetical protein